LLQALDRGLGSEISSLIQPLPKLPPDTNGILVTIQDNLRRFSLSWFQRGVIMPGPVWTGKCAGYFNSSGSNRFNIQASMPWYGEDISYFSFREIYWSYLFIFQEFIQVLLKDQATIPKPHSQTSSPPLLVAPSSPSQRNSSYPSPTSSPQVSPSTQKSKSSLVNGWAAGNLPSQPHLLQLLNHLPLRFIPHHLRHRDWHRIFERQRSARYLWRRMFLHRWRRSDGLERWEGRVGGHLWNPQMRTKLTTYLETRNRYDQSIHACKIKHVSRWRYWPFPALWESSAYPSYQQRWNIWSSSCPGWRYSDFLEWLRIWNFGK